MVGVDEFEVDDEEVEEDLKPDGGVVDEALMGDEGEDECDAI